jgi:hypothetical protein
VTAGTHAPDIPEHIMFPFGQSAKKYFQPPHFAVLVPEALILPFEQRL